jgi:hypothetical protein
MTYWYISLQLSAATQLHRGIPFYSSVPQIHSISHQCNLLARGFGCIALRGSERGIEGVAGIESHIEDIASRTVGTVGTVARPAGVVRHMESVVLRTWVVVLRIEGTLR